MLKKLGKALKTDRYLQIILSVFIVGTFLRFYRLSAFVTFLADQARDAIVIKRILTLEHFPAIGPVTSIGNVYLGSFYYYFIAPWLLLFKFDPIGPAVGVAVFSSLFILINYIVVKDLFDRKTALLSSILIAFSSTLIDLSRFSWNPNLLPLFSLLTVYFFIIAFEKKKLSYFFISGAFLSFSIQLHYLALILLPAFFVVAIKRLSSPTNRTKKNLLGLFLCLAGFILFCAPLIIFDLRHQFMNSRNFLSLIVNSSAQGQDKISNFLSTGFFLDKFAFSLNDSVTLYIPFIISLIFSLFLIVKSKAKVSDFSIFYFIAAFGIALYGGPKYPHYFAPLYSLFFVIVAFLFAKLPKTLWGYGIIALFFGSFILANFQHYLFLTNTGSNQIEKAKKISKVIYDNISQKKYMLTAIPEVYSDHTARYFLEIWNKKSLERDETKQAQELFVICEKPCKPIGNPLYDIAIFSARKIAGKWTVDDVTIYKLTR